MKFVHLADLHIDSAFGNLSNRAGLGTIRRLDQRNALKKIIEYIMENKIEYLFIPGDFYEHKTIRESTIIYINKLFAKIPNTKIFITPGNHDPFIKESYYKLFNWEKNVTIIGETLTKIEEPEFDLYGYGFESFFPKTIDINNFTIENPDKINILMTHANLDGGKVHENYNPLFTKDLKEAGFDYVALGHIHKSNLVSSDQIIVYPGSTCSLGFDELGKHGAVVGEITRENNGNIQRKIEFLQLDTKEFIRIECKVDEMQSLEDLAEFINNMEYESNKYYEIILTGGRFFEINKGSLFKLLENENIVKIKDTTQTGINIEELANETSLRGIFAKKMIEKRNNGEIDEETLEKAIEYGFNSLSGKK